MQKPRDRRRRALLYGLLSLLLLQGTSAAAGDEPQHLAPAPNRDLVAAYTAEFTATCGPPVYPGSLGAMLTASAPEGWRLQASGPPPLVSHERVLYSMVGTSGETSLPSARIFAEVQNGGELSFKSDKGKNVVVQADMKSICWDIDQARAIELAKKDGLTRALFVVMRTEDMTADVNPHGELGSQKSVRVSMDMTLVSTSSGAVLASFSDEASRMDLSANTAARRAARSLLVKGFKAMASAK